jgi:hypothetical protein
VRAAELRDRVVAVLVEDLRVELLRALDPDRRRARGARGNVAGELVEEEAAQRLRRSRVAREERPFTVSGRLIRPKTCRSVLVKNGASASRSAAVKVSAG